MTIIQFPSAAGVRPTAHSGDAPDRVVTAAPGTHVRAGWPVIITIAAAVTLADGFWVTSLQGAIGAIARNQPPMQRWLRDSVLMVPLFVIGVLAALALARRVVRPGWPDAVKVAAAGLVIVAATTVVGVGEVATSSAIDYRIQLHELSAVHAAHTTSVAPNGSVAADTSSAAVPTGSNDVLRAQRHDTLHVHLRAIRHATVVVAITNVALVAWLLALFGWSLSGRRTRPTRRRPFAAVNHS